MYSTWIILHICIPPTTRRVKLLGQSLLIRPFDSSHENLPTIYHLLRFIEENYSLSRILVLFFHSINKVRDESISTINFICRLPIPQISSRQNRYSKQTMWNPLYPSSPIWPSTQLLIWPSDYCKRVRWSDAVTTRLVTRSIVPLNIRFRPGFPPW